MAETEFKYDVFISYNHTDEGWAVNTLLPALEDAGLKVCIDYRDFEAGKPAAYNMQGAAKGSRYVLVVASQNWLNGEWTHFEVFVALHQNPSGSSGKIIPLLIEAGIEKRLPDMLAIFTYVDFTRKDHEQFAWKQLFTALGKPDVRIPSNPDTPDISSHETWHLAHPYPMPPNFTGRVKERATLTHWLKDDAENRLFILRALGGFGKSAVSWHWLTHDVDEKEFPKALWWSFYEGDASFEHFVEETLKYIGCDAPQGKRAQVDELLKAMQGQKTLLILDGFERALRAYSSMGAAYQGDEEPKPEDNQLDCTDINAEWFLKGVCSLPKMKGKVLMTTRLTPRAIKPRGEFMLGCREVELTAMDKADAVLFFQRQKIRGTHTEIEAACEPYGYHPLSLRLLAGRITKDFEHPGDIVVAQHLKIDGDIVQQKHHVLEASYNGLPAPEQKLLSTLACFRSPVELKTIDAIVGATLHDQPAGNFAPGGSPLQVELHDLVERGLLHFDSKNKKFDLHPIVRRYAYDRLTATERMGAHERLVNYYAAVPKPEKVEKLEDLVPVIELYHHMVEAGNLVESRMLFSDRLASILYFQFGAYQLCVELLRALFLDGEDKPPRLKEESDQAWTLNMLAAAYAMSGQPRRAALLFEMNLIIREKQDKKDNIGIVRVNVAQDAQFSIGALNAADCNLRQAISLAEETDNEFRQARGHHEIGRLLSYLGAYDNADIELSLALKFYEKIHNPEWQGKVWEYRALLFLFLARANFQSSTLALHANAGATNLKSSIDCAQRALELADETARTQYPYPRDYVRAYWLLGAAYRTNNELTLADENLSKALYLCRQINLVNQEADILLDVARLRYAQANFKDAQEKASEALVITERCGYVLQGADVHLFLAALAENGYKLEEDKNLSDKDAALLHAREALKLATCDGPPYYYKVAYEEAERMIERLKA